MTDQPLVSKEFTDAMEKKLQKKYREYGDSWKTMPFNEMVVRFRQEVHEFLLDTCNEEECVDVSNMAQFLYLRIIEMKKYDKVMHMKQNKGNLNSVAHCPYCNCDIDNPYVGCRCKCHNLSF